MGHRQAAATVSLKSERFGADPPAGLIAQAELATAEKFTQAVGLNTALFMGAQAASVREAWRLALFSVVSPLGKLVEAELRRKLDPGLTLSAGRN